MATKIGLVLALDGEKEFSAGLKNAASSTKLMQAQLKSVEETYKGNANSLEALRAKQEALKNVQEAAAKQVTAANAGYKKANENYQKLSKALEEYREKIENAKTALKAMEDAGEKGSDTYKAQEAELEKLTAEMKDLELQRTKENTSLNNWTKEQIKAKGELNKTNQEIAKTDKYLEEAEKSTDKCATSIDELGNEVKETGKDFNTAGKNVSKFGDLVKAHITADVIVGALKAIGQAAIDAAKAAVEVGMSFEAEMSKVAAVSGASNEELERMSEVAKTLGANSMFSATQVASAFEYMSLAGWSTQESIAGIEGVLNLAAVSGMELASASDMVTDSLSAFGLSANDSSHLVDMLATAQANSNTSAEQMGEAYSTAAANMHTAGQSAETVTAILSGMADVGDKGAAAGTKLSAIMAQITAKMKDGAIAIGDTTVAVQDESGNFPDLIDILADVESATEGMGSAEKSAALSTTFNRTSIAGLNEILAEGTGQIRNYKDMLEQCDGAAANMAEQITDNLAGDITEFNSATEGLGIAIYQYLDGPLRSVVQFCSSAISGLTDLITPQKTALDTFIEDVQKSNEEVSKILDNVEGKMDSASTAVSSLEAYKNLLIELNSKSELNEYEQYQLKRAIEEVGNSVPGLSGAYDSLNGTLNLTNEELETLFKNAELNAQKQAFLSANAEALEANAKAVVNVAKAQAGEMEAINQLNEALGTNYKTYEDINALDFSRAPKEYKEAIWDAHEAVVQANEGLERSEKDLELIKTAYENTTTAIGEYNEENGHSATSTEDARKEQLSMRKAVDETAEAVGNLAEEEGALSEETEEMAEKQKTAISALQNVRDEYHKIHEDIKADVQDKVSLFETFDGGKDMTVEDMLSNLNSGLDGIKNWESNLQELSQYVGDVISPEFYNYILRMGTDGANAVQHMLTTINEQGDQGKGLLKEMSDKWTEQMDISEGVAGKLALTQIALKAGLNELGSTSVDFSNLQTSISYAVENALGKWGDLETGTLEKLQATIAAAEAMGVKIPDGLAAGIMNGSTVPADAIEQLTGAMEGTMEGILSVADEMGMKIPQEISEKISAGGNEALEGYKELLDLLANADVDLSAGGEKGAKSFSEGLTDSGETETAAGELVGDAVEELQSHQEEFATSGEEAAGAYAEGIGDTSQTVKAAETNTKAVLDAIRSKKSEMEAAGREAGAAYAAGIAAQQGTAQNAAVSMSQAALSGARSAQSGFHGAGVNMAYGLASGINSGASAAINAAASMAYRSLQAAKAALAIHSPSRKFKNEVGAQIPAGMAFGIKEKEVLAVKASASMSEKVLSKATAWLKEYKKSEEVSLADEQYYWEQVLKKVKAGTNAYAKVVAKIGNLKLINQSQTGKAMAQSGLSYSETANVMRQINNNFGIARKDKQTQEEYYADLLKAADKYMQNRQSLNTWSLQAQLEYYKKIQSMLKKESQAWYDAQSKINQINGQIISERMEAADKYIEHGRLTGKLSTRDEVEYWTFMLRQAKKGTDEYWTYYAKLKEARQNYYDGLIQQAQTYIDRQTLLGKMGAKEELEYWRSLLKEAKKGSDQYYEILGSIKAAKENVNATAASNAQTLLNTYMTYMKVNNKQQMQYWAIMRKSAKYGTAERVQMDAMYLQSRQAYYDELREMDEKYLEDVKNVNEKLKDDVDSLTDTYNDAVRQRKDQILSMNMFEEYNPTGYDANTLIKNLQTQVQALALWQKELQNLKKRGISQDLYEALAAQGPDAAANVYAISRMTDEQLQAYENLFKARGAIAQAQAVKDNEQLRMETEQQIQELQVQAQNQLEDLWKEYRKNLAEINAGISEDIKEQLRDLVSGISEYTEEEINKMALALRDAMGGTDIVETYKRQGIREQITSDLRGMSEDMGEIGEHALDGLLLALQDNQKIEESSQQMIDNIKREMQAAALIHSPSVLMREEVGKYIGEGVAVGIEESIPDAIAKAQLLMQEVLAAARAELNSSLAIENVGELNRTLGSMSIPTPIVNIDNSALNARLQDMTNTIVAVQNRLNNMVVIMDSGAIVGELQPLLSYQNAIIATRSGRGRL